MPRPRALDDAKRREVCALVSAGCGIAHAARYVGTSAITVRREAMRNPEFYEELRKAELAAQVLPLQALKKAAQTHWRAAAWYLERTHPDEFGRRNAERFTTQQVETILADFYETIFGAIDDKEIADRVNDKVCDYLEQHQMEARAVLAPRPDVHSRRNRQRKEDAESPTTSGPPPVPVPPRPPLPPLPENFISQLPASSNGCCLYKTAAPVGALRNELESTIIGKTGSARPEPAVLSKKLDAWTKSTNRSSSRLKGCDPLSPTGCNKTQ